MLHQSLCSATGMPHSTHTRTRTFGSAFFENSFWKIVIVTQTDIPAPRFAENPPNQGQIAVNHHTAGFVGPGRAGIRAIADTIGPDEANDHRRHAGRAHRRRDPGRLRSAVAAGPRAPDGGPAGGPPVPHPGGVPARIVRIRGCGAPATRGPRPAAWGV